MWIIFLCFENPGLLPQSLPPPHLNPALLTPYQYKSAWEWPMYITKGIITAQVQKFVIACIILGNISHALSFVRTDTVRNHVGRL
jgi:hypothetical protein